MAEDEAAEDEAAEDEAAVEALKDAAKKSLMLAQKQLETAEFGECFVLQ